jgi:hypothetical protein
MSVAICHPDQFFLHIVLPKVCKVTAMNLYKLNSKTNRLDSHYQTHRNRISDK